MDSSALQGKVHFIFIYFGVMFKEINSSSYLRKREGLHIKARKYRNKMRSSEYLNVLLNKHQTCLQQNKK